MLCVIVRTVSESRHSCAYWKDQFFPCALVCDQFLPCAHVWADTTGISRYHVVMFTPALPIAIWQHTKRPVTDGRPVAWRGLRCEHTDRYRELGRVVWLPCNCSERAK